MSDSEKQPLPMPDFSHPIVPGWNVPPLLTQFVSYSPPPDEIGSVIKSPPPGTLPETPPANYDWPLLTDTSSYGWFGESDEMF